MDSVFHETKTHGKVTFPYTVYYGNIPKYILSYPLHWHNEMELIYNVHGTGIITVEDKQYTFNEGDLIILPPEIIHAIEQLDNEVVEYYNILFQLSLLTNNSSDPCYDKFLRPFYNRTIICPHHFNAESNVTTELLPYIKALIENRHKSYNGYELMVKSNLYAIMHIIILNCTAAKANDISSTNTYNKLKESLSYIHKNYMDEISVKDAAKQCGFSESHFMKLFKNLTGISFTQYLKNYRLELAANQILNTKEHIIDIAHNTGFSNHSYFTRSFLDKYNVTPSNYRKKTFQK